MKTIETKSISKNTDLYFFSSPGMPAVQVSHDSLPPIVEAVFSDHEEIYANSAREAGICGHPQMAAAITAECPEHYLPALIETNIEAGTAAVYGATLMRSINYFCRSLAATSDLLRDSDTLSNADKALLMYACNAALSARDPSTLDERYYRSSVDDYLRAKQFVVATDEQRDNSVTEQRYPAFSRYKGIIDEIYKASMLNIMLDPSFFANAEPNTENYVKGFFALVSSANSEIQKCALDYFARLDPRLLERLKFGLEHNYFQKNA